MLAELGILHDLKVRARGDGFTDQSRIGMEDGFAIRVDDRDIVDHRPIAQGRIQHRIQIKVGRKIIGDGASDFCGVAGVNVGAGEVRDFGCGDVSEFRIQVVRGVVGERNSLTQYVRNVDIRK